MPVRAAALGGVLREYLMGVRYPLLSWALEGAGDAGQQGLSGLEFIECDHIQFDKNPGSLAPGLLGVSGMFISTGESPSPAREDPF